MPANCCVSFVCSYWLEGELTEPQPVPSVVPLEHHLLPLLAQLQQLLLDLDKKKNDNKKNAISAHETTPVRRRAVISRGLASLAQVGIQAAGGQWLI